MATTETIAATFLVREAITLHLEHPRIELEVVTGIAASNLLKREADLALRAGPRPSQQSVVARRLGSVPWGIFASAAYKKRHPFRAGVGWGSHEVVGYCDDLVLSPGGRWLAESGASKREVFRTNNLFAAAEAARAGWGLVVLPVFLGDARSGLVRLARDAVARTDLWLIVHPELQRNGRVRAVMQHLAEAVTRASVVDA